MATRSHNSEGIAAVVRVAASVVLAVLLVAACSDGSGERENAAAVAANAAQADGGRWDMLDLAQIRFEVIRSVSDWDAESVVVEFYVGSSEAARALEERVAGFPPTLLALREKGTPGEEGRYRLVNSESLWTEQPGGGLVAPLAEDGEEREFAAELAEIKGLKDLGGHLEAARRDCDGECGLSQAAWNR